ncbi:MAG: YicC family protein, partial [Saprospiraceae bacterium]|nr:YicC family protein [Saprospiraceae bacterium]
MASKEFFMLFSMTSYGRVSAPLGDKSIVIELKTLNSKFVDLRLRLPANFYEKEMWIRKHIHDRVHRGKVEATLNFQNEEGGEIYNINRALFKDYFTQLQTISDELGLENGDLLGPILKLPEVVSSSENPLNEEDWEIVKSCLDL